METSSRCHHEWSFKDIDPEILKDIGSQPGEISNTDAVAEGKYHFLDVGAQMYGDCIVIEFDKIRVLIDGSHEKDFVGQDGYDSTPEQFNQIFGTDKTPHPITLLVVTHCHQDHIGALPKLVSEGIIAPEWALITDHRLGFGRSQDNSDAVDLADERTRRLAAALREEDALDMSDAALQEFIDGASVVEPKYEAMIENLKAKGVKVIEYQGKPLPEALLRKMKPTGMTMLGPSADQLLFAAEQISKTNKEASDAVVSALKTDAQLSDVELYRALAVDVTADASSANPRGNGMNCQSITLAFGPKNARVLLAGDMQFAEPGVKGADEEVAKLLEAVKAEGPYRLYKTTHHTSHNGQNDDILSDLGNPKYIVHSGGLHDKGHPFPKTLQILKGRSKDIVFARTDHNGRVTVQPHLDSAAAITKTRGRFNDFTPNTATSRDEVTTQNVRASERAGTQIIIVNLPDGPVGITVAGVEIVVRGDTASVSGPRPAASRKDAPAQRAPSHSPITTEPATIQLAGGRALPKLLFVTDSTKLTANIGRSETLTALNAVRSSGQPFLDMTGLGNNAVQTVRSKLSSDNTIVGVVILGGYDVMPSMVIDVLPPQLRSLLGTEASRDNDNFCVWSDENYTDIDGDGIGERPISRIPDARDASLFLTALQVGGIAPQDRFGVRNIARPFADAIWTQIGGQRSINVSKMFLSDQVVPSQLGSGSQYFMLHGMDTDGSVFLGEDPPNYTRAFTVDKVPAKFDGVVFSGCCWGALSVSQTAIEAGTTPPAPRVVERSIALSYLKSGANAFIGCTGSHYSGPDTDENLNPALPFHSAFWKTLPKVRFAPALALFGARTYYGGLIASGTIKREPLDLARRLKNRAQFTCLGLGW